jgi:Ca-activated chloride channel family protein
MQTANAMKRTSLVRTLLLASFFALPACSEDSGYGSSGSETSDGGGFSGEDSGTADSSGSESGTSASGGDTGTGDDGTSTGATGGDDSGGDDTGGDPGTGTSTGDGDGDQSTTGDGDGDESGDGDGDGEACDLDTEVTLYLSPDDSNSMSSPAQVKQVLEGTGIPSLFHVNIRPWEFMNYYNFDYTPAAQSELAITAEMANGEIDGQFRMQIAVSSESMTQAQRPPMNITLVMDTSGSMAGKPMADMKETARAIAASLKDGDVVSLLEWDTGSSFSLAGYAVSGPNDATLLEKIDELQSGGGTNLSGGLTTGYELAQQSFDASFINRLVLMSDGGANAGVTDAQIIGENAALSGSDGIYMVGVGVSDSDYDDELMDTVTDLGKGASVFVHNSAEAWTMFNQNFVNTMAIAARDVQVQLDMPPGFDIEKFSGEEISGDPTEIEPQHISPNDNMVFHQVIENCEPDSVTLDQEITVTARYQDAWSFENKEVSANYTIGELVAAQSPQLFKGRAILSYAEALQLYKDDPANKAEYFDAAIVEVEYAMGLLPDDPDLEEILMMLQSL